MMSAGESAEHSATDRSWHISSELAQEAPPVESAASTDSDASDGEARPVVEAPLDQVAGQVVDPPVLPPLWLRIVTGKSFAWRLRRVRNWVRRAPRLAARRLKRWIDVHPEIRHAAATGTLHHLATRSDRDRLRRSFGAPRPYVASVDVNGRVTMTTLQPTSLSSQVELRENDCSSQAELLLSDAGSDLISVRGPDGLVGDLLAPIDLKQWNPSLRRTRPSNKTRVPLTSVASAGTSPGQRLAKARTARAVTCEPDPHPSVDQARLIVQLACAGVPLVGSLSTAQVELIGAGLSDAISGACDEDWLDDRRRELHSLRLCRAALRDHSPRGWWADVGSRAGVDVRTDPRVSVLLPSMRPDDVIDAARSVARQTGVEVQLVVGLHGSHMPADLDARLGDAFPGELVIRRCGDDLNLGQVMNELTSAADGELVSKWDDDDWYDTLHLADLVHALEYSGAGMVGKGAEFIFLETLDLTVRRFAAGGDRWSPMIAGSTLLLSRDELVETRWVEAPRRVDSLFIEKFQSRGRKIYRSHGFGYVVRRQSSNMSAHTWAVDDGYFLRQAHDQRAGLDLDFAGFGVES